MYNIFQKVLNTGKYKRAFTIIEVKRGNERFKLFSMADSAALMQNLIFFNGILVLSFKYLKILITETILSFFKIFIVISSTFKPVIML